MTPIYCEHVVAFIDLLGFKDAVLKANDDEQEDIFLLLQHYADESRQFNARSEPTDSGSQLHYSPNISSFSDAIVISYNLTEMSIEFNSPMELSISYALMQLQGYLAHFARAAWKHKLLLRGGVTIGQLFHTDKVIFGKAFIEAYELESKIAFYPRIIISDLLASKCIHRDFLCNAPNDGLYEMRFMKEAIFGSALPGDDYAKNVTKFIKDIEETIAQKMSELNSGLRMTKMTKISKWTYFKNRFEAEKDHFLSIFKTT